jgi:hypothetical protein
MTTIHMDTEVVLNLVNKIKWSTEELDDSINDIVRACRRMDWDSDDRDRFIRRLKNAENRWNDLLERQDQLANMLQREIEQWNDRARSFNEGKLKIIIDTPATFDNAGFGISTTDTLVDIVYWTEILKKIKFAKYIPIINLILGIWEDRRNGDPWGRAIFSELVDAALNLIPIVGLYTIALGITQIGFSMFALGGNVDYANASLEYLEKFDFTEKLGDAVVDFATQDPMSFINYLVNPAAGMTDPDIRRFFSSFIEDNMRDFGWEKGAAWLENATETEIRFMQPVYESMPMYQGQKVVENFVYSL